MHLFTVHSFLQSGLCSIPHPSHFYPTPVLHWNMRVSLLLVSIAYSATQVASQAASCEESGLKCHQGSTCVVGEADFSNQAKDINGLPLDFHKIDNLNGWHCECPDGMTGLRCNRKFEECGTTGHFCYHGGECIDGLEDVVEEDSLLFCNCSAAEYNGNPMVGKFCEIQGTVQCGDTDIFCTNNGACADGFETRAHPCDCQVGHRGPHCEFDAGFVPACNLTCANAGACTLGIKSYEDAMHAEFWALHDGNFQYCSCPDGWYGLTCQTKGETCGDATCFNGAACLQTEHSDGVTRSTCDCSTANTNETSFSGEFCENSATTYCTSADDPNGKLFCVNGGTCKEETHEGCDCPEGFNGPSCEFRDSQTTMQCRLQCQNGGSCRSGTKDTKLFEQFGDELKKFNETHRLWEHCVCPEGFFGIQCEHQLEICPGGEHVCLHGSKCVAEDDVNGDNQHVCDCDDASTAIEKFAGKFCQYTSTDICTISGTPGVGKASFAFCVNDGKCKAKVADNEEHPGCACSEGFNGPHCEFLEATSVLSPESQQGSAEKTSKGLVVGLVLALILLVILVTGSLLRKYLFRSQIETDTGKGLPSSPSTQNISPSGSEEYIEETVDMHGSPPVHELNLQVVEII